MSDRDAVSGEGGYRYDVFVSYRRSGAGYVAPWVHNHFHPLLRNCLADQLPDEPRIFIDVEQEFGAYWPATLANALRDSRLLVPVWSPKYFRSPWCLAEWHTMMARERIFDLAGERQPLGLVYPVIFSDRENFPAEAQYRQARDLKRWSVPGKEFRRTKRYCGLHDAVQAIAVELADRLRRVPPWRPDWPVVRPDPPLPPPADPPLL
jgi:hypothetical protein